jgi:hypothetical protein
MINVYKIGTPGRRPLEKPAWTGDNIKTYTKELGREDVDCNHLVQNRVGPLVNCCERGNKSLVFIEDVELLSNC